MDADYCGCDGLAPAAKLFDERMTEVQELATDGSVLRRAGTPEQKHLADVLFRWRRVTYEVEQLTAELTFIRDSAVRAGAVPAAA